jgi:DNA-binding GntR family transcriptional regulator
VRLRDMIIEGTLAPGTRLNERVLCEQLMVSRTPLREAFKVLAGEGLIELLPNRGAQVAEMSVADIEQTFEVLGALEALSGQLACERILDAKSPRSARCITKCRRPTRGATWRPTTRSTTKSMTASTPAPATRC